MSMPHPNTGNPERSMMCFCDLCHSRYPQFRYDLLTPRQYTDHQNAALQQATLAAALNGDTAMGEPSDGATETDDQVPMATDDDSPVDHSNNGEGERDFDIGDNNAQNPEALQPQSVVLPEGELEIQHFDLPEEPLATGSVGENDINPVIDIEFNGEIDDLEERAAVHLISFVSVLIGSIAGNTLRQHIPKTLPATMHYLVRSTCIPRTVLRYELVEEHYTLLLEHYNNHYAQGVSHGASHEQRRIFANNRTGQVQYYIRHLLVIDRVPTIHYFAYVCWYCTETTEQRFANEGLEEWKSTFGQDDYQSILPVHRIFSQVSIVGYSDHTDPKSAKIVVIPLTRRRVVESKNTK
ncbi:hypothetical protein BDB00DRAFT_878166 [Zychaea mexicana]|uniref:uncharacterized protein n=1 Tax=Zychaea mexicana TaxID=64656 RepID=UPI0022FE680F|nr:uncharacterized protein BDB00DRAFT_878166 [Zychaea mexicana]KAI9484999.1 hypothetical protein BDB00DRAFT_878166 [Zychaea mexicana]